MKTGEIKGMRHETLAPDREEGKEIMWKKGGRHGGIGRGTKKKEEGSEEARDGYREEGDCLFLHISNLVSHHMLMGLHPAQQNSLE